MKEQEYSTKELEFGTGGLRGILGEGPGRINPDTIRKVTQGLADYIVEQGAGEKGVAIAYDSRRMSEEFAKEAALCLAANGIKAYVFDALRPTPELSFAVRRLGCTAGIVITASHNPPQYNGYKVYWEDGAQITAPRDQEIIRKVRAVQEHSQIKTISLEQALAKGLYESIGKEIDDAYIEEIRKQIIHPKILSKVADQIKIVYTPLCGTGSVLVPRILTMLGFRQIFVVPEQEKPDPEFSTLRLPNPEDPEAFTYAIRLAKEVEADIVLATDPDADRLGMYCKDNKTGEYVAFTGNMSGMLMAEYILRERTAMGTMPKKPALVTTIVTTDMTLPVTECYGVKRIEVLTGFKYIGEQIRLFEETGSYHYVFGLEESYGCLAGTYARDKDACMAAACLCEVAAYCRQQGLTLWDMMQSMYEKYGYYWETQYTLTLEGEEASTRMGRIMEMLRRNPPAAFGTMEVQRIRDYESGWIQDVITGDMGQTDLPRSNVLYFELSGGSWCCVRPSGTEPKMKFYMGVKGESLKDARKKAEELTGCVKALFAIV